MKNNGDNLIKYKYYKYKFIYLEDSIISLEFIINLIKSNNKKKRPNKMKILFLKNLFNSNLIIILTITRRRKIHYFLLIWNEMLIK